MNRVQDLIRDDNELFKDAVEIISIIFCILVVVGLLFEYCYLRPRHRMIQSAKRKKISFVYIIYLHFREFRYCTQRISFVSRYVL